MLIADFDAAILRADKFETSLRLSSNSVISSRVNSGRCYLITLEILILPSCPRVITLRKSFPLCKTISFVARYMLWTRNRSIIIYTVRIAVHTKLNRLIQIGMFEEIIRHFHHILLISAHF